MIDLSLYFFFPFLCLAYIIVTFHSFLKTIPILKEIFYCDGVRYLRMITNQPSWSGPFGLVVTCMGYGAGGPGSVPAVGTCGVALSFLLHWGLVRPVVQHGLVGVGKNRVDSPTWW
jgi:hypothetical protein